VRSLVYTNPLGVSVTLYRDPYLITTLDGIDLPTVDEQEQKAPYQDGTTYLDSLFEPRTIVVTGAIINIQALGAIFTNRATIISALNPKNGPGVLTYTNDNAVYTTICTVSQASFPNKLATDPFQTFQIQFYCNDPYWYSNISGSITMSIVTGGFSFPFSFPFSFGTYTGNIPTSAVNAGDSITPVIISILGPCLNPVIRNTTTGELIRCAITLTSGDILSINTKFGSKSVVLNTSGGATINEMSALSSDSTFWQLAIGNNLITFNDDTQQSAESCVVTWTNRFSGR
jgi:hypothetical protein